MTKDFDKKNLNDKENFQQIDNICEECSKEDKSVSHNLILTGFKLCKSCSTSKTVFPI